MNKRSKSWIRLFLSAAVCTLLFSRLCSTCDMGNPVEIDGPGEGPCDGSHLFFTHLAYNVSVDPSEDETFGFQSCQVEPVGAENYTCTQGAPPSGANLMADSEWNTGPGYLVVPEPVSVITVIICHYFYQGQEHQTERAAMWEGQYYCSPT